MTKEFDAEFDSLLCSLAVPPEEATQRDALKERITARIVTKFPSLPVESDPVEITFGIE